MAPLTQTAALSLPPEAVVAAGLLEATEPPDVERDGLGVEDVIELLADRLRPLLHGNTLWQPASVDEREAERLRRDDRLTIPAWWRPDALDPAAAEMLSRAWHRAVPDAIITTPPGYAMQRALRIRVDDPADARLLRSVGSIGDLILAPSLPSDYLGLGQPVQWHWPMNVAVTDGPRAAEWMEEVRRPTHFGMVYTADLIPDVLALPGAFRQSQRSESSDFYDMVIVDASSWTSRWVDERLDWPDQDRRYPTSCIIAVADRSPATLIDNVMALYEPALAVAFPTPPAEWWYPLFHNLSHDYPIDVAAVMAEHRALVATPERGSELTAPARWFFAAAESEPTFARQLTEIEGWDFSYESGASSRISRLGQAVEHRTGSRPAVVGPLDLPKTIGPPMAFPPTTKATARKPAAKKPAMKKAAKKRAAKKKPVKKKAAKKKPVKKKAAKKRPAKRKAAKKGSAEMASGTTRSTRGKPAVRKPAKKKSTRRSTTRATSDRRYRHLVADFWPATRLATGEQPSPYRSVLPPNTDVVLEVRIAIPELGQPAVEEAFPAVATDQPTEILEVVVTSDELWGKPQREEISLPTAPEHLDEPSTSAEFVFTTPQTGRVVEFDVVVFFRNRPLQAARLTAPVRTRSFRTRQIRFQSYVVTGRTEPTREASPVAASLDARGSEIRDLDGNRLALSNVQDVLDKFEELLSQSLGQIDAPNRLDDDEAVKMMIKLARRGTQLHDLLAVFNLDRKPTINLLVNKTSRLFPIELVYDGKAPTTTARPCRHVTDPEKRRDSTPCRRSALRVCPYRFWGMSRVISRSVMELTDGDKPPVPNRASTLTPSPVLYAATTIADEASSPPRPSTRVEQAVKALFGAVVRVTSWTKWRRQVKTTHPKLLVVLGHTDIEGGEIRLHIGSRSKPLTEIDIDRDVIGQAGEPPPILVLMACATAALGGPFGSLPGKFAVKGAGAVIGTLSKINGPQGAEAAAVLLKSIHDTADRRGRLSEAMTEARRSLVAEGLVVGLVLVSHGEIDVLLEAPD